MSFYRYPGERAIDAARVLRITRIAVPAYLAVFVVLSYFIGDHPYKQFKEGGAVDVMSAVFHAMTAALSWVCLLLLGGTERGRSFWLLLALGFTFFALDELLEIHEQTASLLKHTLGSVNLFRNWNDALVFLYGIGGLAVATIYRAELRADRAFLWTVALGFGFFALHTGIDSLFRTGDIKNVFEETAKLCAAACFTVGVWSRLLGLLEGAGFSSSTE